MKIVESMRLNYSKRWPASKWKKSLYSKRPHKWGKKKIYFSPKNGPSILCSIGFESPLQYQQQPNYRHRLRRCPTTTTNKFVPLNRPTMAGSQDGFEGSQKCVVVSKVIGDLSQDLDFFPLLIVVPSRNDWESNKWHFTSFETLFQTPLQLFEAFHCLGKYLRKTWSHTWTVR